MQEKVALEITRCLSLLNTIKGVLKTYRHIKHIKNLLVKFTHVKVLLEVI